MADAAQDSWISRVLGYALPRSGSGRPMDRAAKANLHDAATRFRDASETVDGQIAKLQQALRATDDTELQEIGEYGVNAVTGNLRVPLLAALQGAVAGNAADQGKLAGAIERFRAHLEDDERVEACDDNPFGVAVSIRATLVPALDELARSIAA